MFLLRWSNSLAVCGLMLAGTVWANSSCFGAQSGVSAQDQTPRGDQREETHPESFHDSLKRMQIKRAENEHKKLVAEARQAAEDAETLAKETSGERLDRAAEKKLREIEKAAKHVRSDSGAGDNNQQLPDPPSNLTDALKQLSELSKHLSEELGKTSRHVVSATVISNASDVLRLVKIVRTYLN